MDLPGQVALVTGASRGIGRAIALCLAREGAKVVVNYRSHAALAKNVVKEIQQAGGQAVAYQADVSDPAACQAMVDQAVGRFGQLDILVNNAGVALEKLLLDTGVEEWDALMGVHLRGMFACSRAALRHMVPRRYGRIVNISSIWGLNGAAGEVAYSTAKAGQIGFTQALAREVASLGITVNAVAPGAIDTEMNQNLTGEYLDEWLDQTPVGRMGKPEEVAAVVEFLARASSGFITGQVWSPNGGIIT